MPLRRSPTRRSSSRSRGPIPAATVALWLTVRAVDRPGRGSLALAFGACLLAVLIRSQLAAVFGALAFGLLALGWRTAAMRRWRASWSRWDWVGAVVLATGALITVVAFLGHRSAEWETATTLWKGRMVEYGSWAAGAFAIGIGVLPAVALLAVLAVPRAERARPGVRAFVVVAGGAVASFGWYAAIKGAYLSTQFSSLIVERNLVYLSPLAFVATAYLLERAVAPAWAVAVGGVAVLAMIVWVPIDRGLDNFPYYEAHGLAILALANREWAWPLGRIDTALVVLGILSIGLLLATATTLRRLVSSSIAMPTAVAIAVGVILWNVTAEVYASIGEHDFSALVESNLPKPNDWVDRAAGDGSVLYLGQRMTDDPIGANATEFWNRSITKVWSVDGTGPGPGHTLTPDLQDVDGTLSPDPETDFVLAANGVEVVGEEVAANAAANATLVRLNGPIRLRSNETGITADGWSIGDPGDATLPARAAYNRFETANGGTGTAVVTLSRETFCPEGVRLPGVAHVRIGDLGRGRDKQPAIVRETGSETLYVPACAIRTVVLPDAERPLARRGGHRDLRARQDRPRSLGRRAARARGQDRLRRPALAHGCDEVREAHAQGEPSERPRALEAFQQRDADARQTPCLRHEERAQDDPREAGLAQLREDLADCVLPRIEVEHELPLGEACNAGEERRPVVGVVDGAEQGRRRDRLRWRVGVEVALLDHRPGAEARARGLHHRRLGVDAAVAQPAREQMLAEAPVATREIEHLVARVELDSERGDQVGPVVQIRAAVGVLRVRPSGGLAGVLTGFLGVVAHRRASVSGCLRTKRPMLRACQSVWRDRNRRSVIWAQSWVTRAVGTYQRSQPACLAR